MIVKLNIKNISSILGMSTSHSGHSSLRRRVYTVSARCSTPTSRKCPIRPCQPWTYSIFRSTAQYQGPQALDAVLQYPMYNALVSAFAIPGDQNMSALQDMI